MSYQNKNNNNMEITTDNIVQLIEDYTNTKEVSIDMVTKKNNDDYQIWLRNKEGVSIGLKKGLPFDDGDLISFYYTSKNDEKVTGYNLIIVNELVGYNSVERQEFIERYKLPKLESELEKYVEKEQYDYAVRNRDFINHLKNKL